MRSVSKIFRSVCVKGLLLTYRICNTQLAYLANGFIRLCDLKLRLFPTFSPCLLLPEIIFEVCFAKTLLTSIPTIETRKKTEDLFIDPLVT